MFSRARPRSLAHTPEARATRFRASTHPHGIFSRWPGRSAEQRSSAWIDRQLSRVNAAVAAMSQGLGDRPWCTGTHISLADIAVGCALGYLDFRFPAITWRSSHPNLGKLADKLEARQSFIDTRPPAA